MNTDNLVLYILMRTDLESMNPGKAMAQASHAYGAAKCRIKQNVAMQKSWLAWMDQTPQDFGTTLVLGGNEEEIDRAITFAQRWLNSSCNVAGWVMDPTYPVRDGAVTHLLHVNTCGFVFGDKDWVSHAVRHLDLHA